MRKSSQDQNWCALSGVSHDDLVENGGSQAWDFRKATASDAYRYAYYPPVQ